MLNINWSANFKSKLLFYKTVKPIEQFFRLRQRHLPFFSILKVLDINFRKKKLIFCDHYELYGVFFFPCERDGKRAKRSMHFMSMVNRASNSVASMRLLWSRFIMREDNGDGDGKQLDIFVISRTWTLWALFWSEHQNSTASIVLSVSYWEEEGD